MRIDLVTLCDAAVEVNGRLHILSSIDYFWAATLPYVHSKCTLVARLRWDGHERAKKHRIRVQLVDADRLPISTELTRKFTAPCADHVDVPLVRHLIVELAALQFGAFGPYGVRVEVDGEELAFLPFSVVPLVDQRPQSACS